MAPSTNFVLNRDPSCPARRSAHRRSKLRVKTSENTRKAMPISVESPKRTTKSFFSPGSKGGFRDPSMNTAAPNRATAVSATPTHR
jgi:hypothetical protein